ncbi:hypothetical protein ACKVMT_06195 [Halobacteriales archaeon Cl-PHB]
MTESEPRVTARMWRTKTGETVTEYVVDGVGYGSAEALTAALGGR